MEILPPELTMYPRLFIFQVRSYRRPDLDPTQTHSILLQINN